jgi:hypothetical protein
MDDFRKYEQMRDEGSSPRDVYLTAKADGLDEITSLRLLRKVFALSLTGAKEVTIVASGAANSLEDFQEKWLPVVEQALAQMEDKQSVNGAVCEPRTTAPTMD